MKEIKIEIGETKRTIKDIIIIQNIVEIEIEIETGIEEVEVEAEAEAGIEVEVEVEINVYDYYKVNKDADNYLFEHRDEFIVDGVYDESKFIDYKLDKMSKNTDKVKFTIYFNLNKDNNGDWSLDEVSEVDEDKILGIYQY